MGKQEHWSLEEFKNYQMKSTERATSKFKAKKTEIDGYTFDSQKEAEYYSELKVKLKAGEINGFCIQPTFILAPKLKYIADFVVFKKDGTSEIIDTKGFKTKEYIAKKKVFEDKYNLKIIEI